MGDSYLSLRLNRGDFLAKNALENIRQSTYTRLCERNPIDSNQPSQVRVEYEKLLIQSPDLKV